MEQNVNILITERNSHVREFLKRELAGEGFLVHLAENGLEMLNKVFSREPLDILILDPDLPDTNIPDILEKINDRVPRLPVVFHTFPLDYHQYAGIIQGGVFVEKQGSSVEKIKHIIYDILKNKNSLKANLNKV
ncbi:MAG: response regulator [Desulfobacteraceae bacterium]|nr:response regulator [Desulfobacteraceae bacterium]MBU4053698.1 response regulator [Pseudomonadota bacterium]